MHLGVLVLALALAIAGALYQAIAAEIAERRYPPPGELVDAGGHQLHLNVTGQDKGGPTVVLETGATGFSSQWGWIQPEVAKFARVVSYDRAGMGWSERSGEPKDSRQVAEELHRALKEVGIEGPYVLVGHSLGGMHVRVFADAYPEEVVGMVLVDTNGPRVIERLTEAELEAGQSFAERAKGLPLLARFGIVRLLDPFAATAEPLPPKQEAQTNALSAEVDHLEAAHEDLMQSRYPGSVSMEQVRNAAVPRDVPLVVINRSVPKDHVTRAHQEAGTELAKLSTHGSHRVVEGADHFSLVTNKEDAQVTVEAIREVVEAARAASG